MHMCVSLNETEKDFNSLVKLLEQMLQLGGLKLWTSSASHFCYENISQSTSTDTVVCFS